MTIGYPTSKAGGLTLFVSFLGKERFLLRVEMTGSCRNSRFPVIHGQEFLNFNVVFFFTDPLRNGEDLIGIPKTASRKSKTKALKFLDSLVLSLS